MNCEKCFSPHNGEYGSGRFCSQKCARGFSTAQKREEINKRVSVSLKGRNSPNKGKPSKRKGMWTDADREKAKYSLAEGLKKKFASIEFDMCGKAWKRRKILEEQNHSCLICGISEWMGNTLPLELDHIDGNRLNNSRENLRILCPNCHSQTDTFRGKNIKEKKNNRSKVDDSSLLQAIAETDNISQALQSVGLIPRGGNYIRAKSLISKHYT